MAQRWGSEPGWGLSTNQGEREKDSCKEYSLRLVEDACL